LPGGLPLEQVRRTSRDAKLALRGDLAEAPLPELARLDDAAFRVRFAGTPVKRTGRDRFIRNVLVAIGNSGDPALADEAVRLLQDPSPLVRAMAVWALGRLRPLQARALASGEVERETDAHVRAEWHSLATPAPAASAAA
jgi:epoxyqueuosine reductase